MGARSSGTRTEEQRIRFVTELRRSAGGDAAFSRGLAGSDLAVGGASPRGFLLAPPSRRAAMAWLVPLTHPHVDEAFGALLVALERIGDR